LVQRSYVVVPGLHTEFSRAAQLMCLLKSGRAPLRFCKPSARREPSHNLLFLAYSARTLTCALTLLDYCLSMAHPGGPERFLQIGEAAERAALTQRTLRYYEEKGLLNPPTRMDGGFRLYSPEDMERVDRIRQLKELLGFSLAEIKEMLEAEDVRLQIKAEWRRDADSVEKAEKARLGREVTLHQLTLIEQKMEKMASLRETLAERVRKYDELLLRFAEAQEQAPATSLS